jgi:predicted transcriptional regulator
MVLKYPPGKKFPTELKEMKYEIEVYARDFGLDFFPVSSRFSITRT